MADALMSLIEQAPASGLAVGGALVAAAVGLTAVKALGGKSASTDSAAPSSKKKKSKKSKKKAAAGTDSELSDAPKSAPKEQEPINLDEFVTNDPDTEEEEAARAEKKRLKRKLKKKKSKTTTGPSDADKEATKKDLAAAAKKDAEEGWETVVSRKKAPKSNKQQ